MLATKPLLPAAAVTYLPPVTASTLASETVTSVSFSLPMRPATARLPPVVRLPAAALVAPPVLVKRVVPL